MHFTLVHLRCCACERAEGARTKPMSVSVDMRGFNLRKRVMNVLVHLRCCACERAEGARTKPPSVSIVLRTFNARKRVIVSELKEVHAW